MTTVPDLKATLEMIRDLDTLKAVARMVEGQMMFAQRQVAFLEQAQALIETRAQELKKSSQS